jgi:Rad3-related DNA helicase
MVAIARVVPDGLLVFFSSYGMMKRLRKRWEVRLHHSHTR